VEEQPEQCIKQGEIKSIRAATFRDRFFTDKERDRVRHPIIYFLLHFGNLSHFKLVKNVDNQVDLHCKQPHLFHNWSVYRTKPKEDF
jgi:hypothetical protein